jgi:nitrogen fixation protein NifU and related proteins
MPLPADSPPPVPLVATAPPDPGVASLYQDIILSHYRAPHHKGSLANATATVEQRNPLCGDVLTVMLRIERDVVVAGAFDARACSIAQATASMLLQQLIGSTRATAALLLAEVDRLVDTPSPSLTVHDAARLGDLRALQSVSRFPARRACVRLVTSALREAVSQRGDG